MVPEPTVFVVDDDAAVRNSLRWLIETLALPVETYGSAQEFLAAYEPSRPGCLVLDLRLPGMSGLELQERLTARGICLPVIVITGHSDVPMAVRALKQGAVDFLEKPFPGQVLLERIQQAIALDARLRSEQAQRADIAARLAKLKPREFQVLQGIIASKSNRTIATELGLSAKTIEVHRAGIMKKMQAGSVIDLVRMAFLVQTPWAETPSTLPGGGIQGEPEASGPG